MKFDEFINTLLKEEEISDREKRISALKSLNDVRTFHVEYQGYDRHDFVPVEKYVVSGVTLWDALQELPEGVFEDVFYLDEVRIIEFEDNEEAVKDYIDNIDTGGFPFLAVYENGELLCGFPEEEGYEDDFDGDF